MEHNFYPYQNLKKQKFCWIHITDIKAFLFLGANEFEEKIGHNLTINLSIKINYLNTYDNLEKTVDYGAVCEHVIQQIKTIKKVRLLEFLAEQILNSIGENFKHIIAAKISIEKAFVPLKEFTGKVKIEVEHDYYDEERG